MHEGGSNIDIQYVDLNLQIAQFEYRFVVSKENLKRLERTHNFRCIKRREDSSGMSAIQNRAFLDEGF